MLAVLVLLSESTRLDTSHLELIDTNRGLRTELLRMSSDEERPRPVNEGHLLFASTGNCVSHAHAGNTTRRCSRVISP